MQPITKNYLYLSIAYVTLLMISNTVASKIVQISFFTIAGATLLFPLTYIFGDVLTEVYGYKQSRTIIWAGFIASIFMALAYALVQYLPHAPFWPYQTSFENILGQTPRIVTASLIAYLAGEFSNSYILSKMKIRMNGKHLWMRTIGSTIVGEGIDSTLFGFIAFSWYLPTSAVFSIILSGYLVKLAIEVIMTPFTYKLVSFLKKKDQIDTYDRGITYNPFNS